MLIKLCQIQFFASLICNDLCSVPSTLLRANSVLLFECLGLLRKVSEETPDDHELFFVMVDSELQEQV